MTREAAKWRGKLTGFLFCVCVYVLMCAFCRYDANTYRPYFDVVSTGEWDTMYVSKEEEETAVSLQDRLIVAAVFAFPVLLILGLRYWH